EIPYTVYRNHIETKTREIPYTVYRNHVETKTREIPYTVYNRVMEQRERTVQYTVRRPVHYTKTVQVNTGHWETVSEERPGPVVRRVVRDPGTWTWDPCACRCVYTPGCCRV